MPEILRHPVTEASAWRPSDFENDDSWIVPFTSAELDEVDAAIRTVENKGLTAPSFTTEDFAAPRLAKRLAVAREELENGRGFTLLRGFPIDRYTEAQARIFYWGLAQHLGTPIVQNAKGEVLAEVTDRGNDYDALNVRGYTTRQALRPHCDSPDCVGLLCLHPSKSGGASVIASSTTIFNEILEKHPECLDLLFGGFHHDLRGEGVTGERYEVTFNKVPIFSYFEGRLSCRYNSKTIQDGMRKAGEPLSPEAVRAVELVGEIALSPNVRFDMDFQKGDVQLLCNHTVLHAREAFEDWPEPERKRRLLRLWLNLPNSRPLAQEFADRQNTGPRGGVHPRDGAGYWSEERYARPNT